MTPPSVAPSAHKSKKRTVRHSQRGPLSRNPPDYDVKFSRMLGIRHRLGLHARRPNATTPNRGLA